MNLASRFNGWITAAMDLRREAPPDFSQPFQRLVRRPTKPRRVATVEFSQPF
ncbi:MAG TPA: hypothetical protein VI306_19490 [Pyrinomonadaceae bacterium]